MVGSALAQGLRNVFLKVNFWSTTSTRVRDDLRSAIAVCARWIAVTQELTTTLWSQPHRAWLSPAFSDSCCGLLMSRLDEVLMLRTVHEQICTQLSAAEQAELDVHSAFAVFADLNPLLQNSYNDQVNILTESFKQQLSPLSSIHIICPLPYCSNATARNGPLRCSALTVVCNRPKLVFL